MRSLRPEHEIMKEWENNPCHPLVSISCITYNHEPYIEDALQGFLSQETDFPFEILIHDDASTDRTMNILREYEVKYPNLIKPIYQKENQSSRGIKISATYQYPRALGKYIAICEGDDYWTDQKKLQKQVDFLEIHPECSACFHNVNVFYEQGNKSSHPFFKKLSKNIFSLEDIASNNFIPTCSTLFRNQLPHPLPMWFLSLPMGDWPLHVYNAESGDYGYLNEILATYRQHNTSIWSSQTRDIVLNKTIHAAEVINQHLDYEFDNNIKRNISRWHLEIAIILNQERWGENVQYHITQHNSYARSWKEMGMKETMLVNFLKYMPNLFRWSWNAYQSFFKRR